MNWKRLITILSGAAPAIASLAGLVPPWVGVVGGVAAGIAVNAEKYMAKREKGAPTFDSKAAEDKVAKLVK